MTVVVQVFIFFKQNGRETNFFKGIQNRFSFQKGKGEGELNVHSRFPPSNLRGEGGGGGNSRVVYFQFKVGEMNIHSRVCLYSIFTAGFLRVRGASGMQSHLL
jgi:hypothetical protein